eukprot:3620364-Rhodomonas_salina.1
MWALGFVWNSCGRQDVTGLFMEFRSLALPYNPTARTAQCSAQTTAISRSAAFLDTETKFRRGFTCSRLVEQP